MKTKERKPRAKRPKQGYLSEDMAPVTIPEVDAAAEELVTYREARMAALKEEIRAAEMLLTLMHKHSLTAYEWEGKIVSIGSKEKISVRSKKDASENGDGNGDE